MSQNEIEAQTFAHIANELMRLRQAVERLMPSKLQAPDWSKHAAWLYSRPHPNQPILDGITPLNSITFEDLHDIDRQKASVYANTAQFVNHKPANNVLLTGARGTGKSSLVRACLQHFAQDGLRMIEVSRDNLRDLPAIAKLVAQENQHRFILYCDDLSFETGESDYKALKTVLDGNLVGNCDNLLVYATSNRRHLLPEFHTDNSGYKHLENGEIHSSEAVEEKIALSERFGLWLSFYPFTQQEYLHIVGYWLHALGLEKYHTELEAAALQWALQRGSRSGRVARQFAVDAAGRIL